MLLFMGTTGENGEKSCEDGQIPFIIKRTDSIEAGAFQISKPEIPSSQSRTFK